MLFCCQHHGELSLSGGEEGGELTGWAQWDKCKDRRIGGVGGRSQKVARV